MSNITHTNFNQMTQFESSPEIARQVAEVQAAITVARRFPRDEAQAMQRVLQSCRRPKLAEQAFYSYNRGGADVSGPSIRLAEELARAWGNIQYGVREVEKTESSTVFEVFCWDLETNIRVDRKFSQDHVRYTKKDGNKALTDSRDIYELVANNAARRLRAVILEVLPSDVIEQATMECEKTLKNDNVDLKVKIEQMLAKFLALGVTKEMIEARVTQKVETIDMTKIIALGKIYTSLVNGVSSVSDWFKAPVVDEIKNVAPPEEKVKIELNKK